MATAEGKHKETGAAQDQEQSRNLRKGPRCGRRSLNQPRTSARGSSVHQLPRYSFCQLGELKERNSRHCRPGEWLSLPIIGQICQQHSRRDGGQSGFALIKLGKGPMQWLRQAAGSLESTLAKQSIHCIMIPLESRVIAFIPSRS